MQILHLSFDYPDQINPNKTKAVKNLCLSQKNHNHLIFSLNRSSRPWDDFSPRSEEYGFSLRIIGLPYGILLKLWMYLAYTRIYKIIRDSGEKPHMIHAHKLTFEGIIAHRLAKKLGIPYILTIRGNTDIKLIKLGWLYRGLYKRILKEASSLLFLAPWTIGSLGEYYPSSIFKSKYHLVPNIVNLHQGISGQSAKNFRFVSVFHLKSLKLKNFSRVVKAFDMLLQKNPQAGLDIIGAGPDEDLVQSTISKSPFSDKYRLLGAMDNQELVQKLPDYMGFVLPSFPETFGIVFIEALSAGIPIVYAENSGIDGYFDTFLFGEKVNHKSVDQICRAMEKILQDNEKYRKEISRLKDSNAFQAFSMENVGIIYGEIIEGIRK